MQANKEPIYIFLHIPKCAGSTIAYHLEKNIPAEERLNLPPSPVKFSQLILRQYSLRKIKSEIHHLKDKDKIRIIYGHGARYGVHTLFNRPGIYFTFVREPITRTVSAYNYRRGRHITDLSFSTWLEKKYNSPQSERPTSKSMISFLSDLGYWPRSKKINRNQAQLLFKKFYFVGLTENFDEDISYIFPLLGIKKHYTNKNISTKFYSLKKGDKIKISQKNQDDLVLYREAVKYNQRFKKHHPDLVAKASRYRQQLKYSRLLYSVLDVIPTYFYQLSALLKRDVPGYRRAVSWYKQSPIYTFFIK